MTKESLIGRDIQDIDTPALLLDIDALERNLKTMAMFMERCECVLRPHVKTHKCAEIARRQIALGAQGVTCAKLGEAEAMAAGGIDDMLIANQVVGPAKARRAAVLARDCRLTVAVDSPGNVDELAEAAASQRSVISALIEVNVGMNRCGLDAHDDALALARHIADKDALEFRGLMGYEGHAVFIEDEAERRREVEFAMGRLLEFRDYLISAGMPVDVVSAAGTGTYKITGRIPGVTELQCGSYCVMDARYVRLLPEFECALTLLAEVVSAQSDERIILDFGRKGVGFDFGNPEFVDPPGLEIISLSEEHARAKLNEGSRPSPGDKATLLPAHCCTTINMHDEFFVIREGRVVDVWPIEARGKFR